MGGALLAGWLRQGLDPAPSMSRIRRPSADVAALMASHGIRVRHQAELPAAPAVDRARGEAADHRRRAADACAGNRAVDGAAVDRRRTDACQSRLASAARARPIVRAMPNTPAAIGQGMTVACAKQRGDARPGAPLQHAARSRRRGDLDRRREPDGCGHGGVGQRAGLRVPARRMSRRGRRRGWARSRACRAARAGDGVWRRRAACAARIFPRPSSGRTSPRRRARRPRRSKC